MSAMQRFRIPAAFAAARPPREGPAGRRGWRARAFTPPSLRPPVAYAAALVLSAASVALTAASGGLLRPTIFLLPLGAVAVGGWLGGFRAGFASCITSAALIWVFILEPNVGLDVADPEDVIRTGLFVAVGALVAGLTESLRSTARAAAAATAEASRSAAEAMEQRLQTELVLRSASDGITVQSAEGRLVYANDAAARLIGFPSAAELLAAPTSSILDRFEILDEAGDPVSPDMLPGRVALRDRVESECLLRYRVRGEDRERWALVRASPALDDRGEVLFAVNVFHDLTDRIEYERELESANRAKSQFLAVMSHELRTPLNAIMGYQELLLHGIIGPVTEKQQEQLARIGQSAHHLLDLIEQVLTLSRIEAGKEELYEEPVAVPELVAQVVALVEPLARRKRLDLEVRIECDQDCVVRSDALRLRQILLNLLSNAVKFTAEGSVRVRVARSDGQVEVTVRDTGPGIPPEDQERIFEPFVQGAMSNGGRAPGTGLGLTVARQLAGLLGGSVELESRPGAGTSFTLRLPATPGSTP